MNRRVFLKITSLLSSASLLPIAARAGGDEALSHPFCEETADLVGLSQGFMVVRHQHQFRIPLSVLANPPEEGYTARSSKPLEGWTDFEGLRNRKDSKGNPLDVSRHSHAVTITQEQLRALAGGKHVTIELEKDGHRFYFVASDAILTALADLK